MLNGPKRSFVVVVALLLLGSVESWAKKNPNGTKMFAKKMLEKERKMFAKKMCEREQKMFTKKDVRKGAKNVAKKFNEWM